MDVSLRLDNDQTFHLLFKIGVYTGWERESNSIEV